MTDKELAERTPYTAIDPHSGKAEIPQAEMMAVLEWMAERMNATAGRHIMDALKKRPDLWALKNLYYCNLMKLSKADRIKLGRIVFERRAE